jgi:hypothetical protein
LRIRRFVKPVYYSFMLRAEVKFTENRASCVEFLRGCVRYGKAAVMTCTAFVSYSPFSRTRASQDLVDRATRLGTERVEVRAETAVQTRGAFLRSGMCYYQRSAVTVSDMRKFNSIHKKSLCSLHRMDDEVNTLFSRISAWVTELDAYSTFPAFDIKHLRGLSRIWVKNRDAIEHISAALLLLDD